MSKIQGAQWSAWVFRAVALDGFCDLLPKGRSVRDSPRPPTSFL